MGSSNGGFSMIRYPWTGKGSTKRIQIYKILQGQENEHLCPGCGANDIEEQPDICAWCGFNFRDDVQ